MNVRKSKYSVNPLILNRWSPRAMSGELLAKEELMTLFEAARWAPSSYNNQPWRFIFATRDSKDWDVLFNLLVDFNKSWTKTAAALVVAISRKNFEFNNKPARTHSFDTGSAWENLAIQATSMNLVAHGMEGLDYEKAKKDLNIPDDYAVEMMFAVGKPGKKEDLSPELQAKEVISDRKPLNEIIFQGKFGNKINL
ncbi:nitroreductase family protein [Candidatus Babeliales bacterium]|nr:nitroreductase family protein [Candidatus Babeliales bacterium]MCF7899719.1 nitroreductase family protein [Candidatus Babeliales bacterium]